MRPSLLAFSLLWLMLQAVTRQAISQPISAFTVDVTACLQQNLSSQNLSSGATSFAWDFCADDALQVKSVTIPAVLPGLSGGYGYKLVEDNGNWYGFAVSLSNNSIYKLDFGNSPMGIPVVTNLGNPGGALVNPQGIDIVNSGGQWFGFVGFTDTDFGLVRLDFGSSLANSPSGTNVGMFGLTGRLYDLKLVQSGGHSFLITVNRDNESITRIDFGNSYLNSVSPSSVYQSSSIAGASLSLGLDVISVGGTWKAIVAAYNTNNIVQVDLGPSLASSALTVDGAYTFPSFANPFRVTLVREGDSYRAFVANNSAITTVVDLSDMNPIHSPAVISQPSLPMLIGIDAIRWKGKTLVEGVNFSNSNFSQIVFEQDCMANVTYTNAVQPVNNYYTQQGNKLIELVATDVSGIESVSAARTVVSSSTSPDISISSQFSCVSAPISFASQNISGNITTYDWNFGDTQHSSAPNPGHLYSSAGSYAASLNVTANNGCKNLVSQAVSVFNVPVADFSLPAALICTNQVYHFVNTTIHDPGSNPTWEWYLNGSLASTSNNFSTNFSIGAQTLQLVATIPNCSTNVTKAIPSVPVGPIVTFSMANNCTAVGVNFGNGTTGADAGYLWDFGDGNTSTSPAPSHSYASPAIYDVVLTASNSAGCQNTSSQPITIYSLPQPDFSVDLPPFSCTHVATPLLNSTPPLSDSNIIGWDWQFGDGTQISGVKFPAHSYTLAADYDVILTATSDMGCVGAATKTITIAASPTADFLAGPACLNQTSLFTDLSSGGVQTRLWQIESVSTGVTNPTHVFTSPGNPVVSLTVTSANGCSDVKSIALPILAPPTLDFSITNVCAAQTTSFNDITPSGTDPVVGWNWNFDGNAYTGNPSSFSFPLPGTFNVKMTTTHQSGCKYTLSRNVGIKSSPIANFTATPDRGDAPLTIQFQNESTLADTYSWKFYDKALSTSTEISPVYTFTSLGSYSAELTAISNNGCVDQMTIPIEVLTPTIDLIMKEFSLVADPLTGNLKAAVTIVNHSNVPVSTVDVEIQLSVDAEFHEVLTMNLQPGESAYRVLASSISATQNNLSVICAEIISEKDEQQDNNKQCIDVKDSEYFFSPYPNPTTGTLQVDWVTHTAGTAVIRIFDSMGKRMFEWNTSSKAGLNQTVIDMAFLAGGIYFVTIDTGLSRSTSRFIRQ